MFFDQSHAVCKACRKANCYATEKHCGYSKHRPTLKMLMVYTEIQEVPDADTVQYFATTRLQPYTTTSLHSNSEVARIGQQVNSCRLID
jgi:hypothetical protein